MNDDSQGRHSV